MMFKYAPRRFLAVLSCLYPPWTTVAWMINLLRAQPWNASLAALYIAFLCTPSSSRNSRRNCRATSKAYIQKSMNQIALQICSLILGNLHVKLAMSSALSDRGSQPFPTSTAPCQRCWSWCSPTIFRKPTNISASRTSKTVFKWISVGILTELSRYPVKLCELLSIHKIYVSWPSVSWKAPLPMLSDSAGKHLGQALVDTRYIAQYLQPKEAVI
jgi:hypothetical protein